MTALAAEPTREVPMVDEATPAPERSLQQRMDALQHANWIRTRRAEFKRDLKEGKEPLADALMFPPDWLLTAKVFDVLLAAPKYGRVKANKALQLARISPSKTVGGMSARQRLDLVCRLRGISPVPRPTPNTSAVIPASTLVPPAPTYLGPGPTTFQRSVLALAVLEFGEINHRNLYAAATALGSNPAAVDRACQQLQEKRLMTITGQPTDAGRIQSSVLPATAAAA